MVGRRGGQRTRGVTGVPNLELVLIGGSDYVFVESVVLDEGCAARESDCGRAPITNIPDVKEAIFRIRRARHQRVRRTVTERKENKREGEEEVKKKPKRTPANLQQISETVLECAAREVWRGED
jgi:hypothetical protein